MTTLVHLSDPTNPSAFPDDLAGGAISIGNFDGVHLGHQALLQELAGLAQQVDGPAVAVTFDPHPASILRPESAPTPLSTMATRAERMSDLRISALVVCHTSREFLAQSAENFFERLVVQGFRARGMVEGENFFFGKDREGDLPLLNRLCDQNRVAFKVANAFRQGEAMVSSSLIRRHLLAGEIDPVSRLYGNGRLHRISGVVSEGEKRGRTIGFPTANLHHVEVLLPRPGVYAARAITEDGDSHAAAVHLGNNPTFAATSEAARSDKVEVHLIDFQGDLYGQRLSVDFIDHVRNAEKFASAEDLRRQLRKDIDQCRTIVTNH
ncbi:MAG: riboflavin biosynthesis protein RibF [Planctomycetota bacterium]